MEEDSRLEQRRAKLSFRSPSKAEKRLIKIEAVLELRVVSKDHVMKGIELT